MASNDENFEDMYSQQEEQQESSRRSKQAAKRAAANASKEALKKAGNATSVATKRAILAALPYIGMAIMALIAILTLVSVLVFLFSGPDMLMGQIIQMADELWTEIKTALVSLVQGDDYAQVTKQHVVDVALYINKSFDLAAYGLVGHKDKNELTIWNNYKAGKAQATDIESDLITEYLAAENRTYMLSTVSISSLYRWWSGVEIFGRYTGPQAAQGDSGNTGTAQNAEFGTGMINVTSQIDAVPVIKVYRRVGNEIKLVERTWDQIKAETGNNQTGSTNNTNNSNQGHGGLNSILTVEPEVDREKRQLILKIKQVVNGKTTQEKYTYNLEGWTGRYGKPIEFLLALHLGTMAPGFAEAIATRPAFDTKVNIRLHKYVELAEVTYNGWTMEETRQEIEKLKKEVWENTMRPMNAMKGYTMYTEKHAEQWAEQKIGITIAQTKQAEEDAKKRTKESYVPYIASVTNHWYYQSIQFKDVNKVSSEDAYVKTEPSHTIQDNFRGVPGLRLITYKSSQIYQVKDPEKKINKNFVELFENTEWEKVDGVEGMIDNKSVISNVTKGKISIGDDMANTITMLSKAAQTSDDAKLVLRDLKEWLEKEKGLKFTDSYILTNKVITDEQANGSINSGSNDGSTGTTEGTASDNIASTTQGNTRLKELFGGSTANIEASGNDAIIKTSEMQEGTTVRSVVNGTISKISDNGEQVQITISSPSNLKGKTLIMDGIKMDSAITEGTQIGSSTPIASTVAGKDIRMTMLDTGKNNISVIDNLKY